MNQAVFVAFVIFIVVFLVLAALAAKRTGNVVTQQMDQLSLVL